MPTESREDLKAHLEAMSPARWQQIDAVLDAALDLPPDERAAYLDAHTADDRALRDEVEALLASFDKTEGILDQPAALAESVLPLPTPSSLEGQHVGAYRVLRQIAQGGMGMVYLAEREDVQKKVALKLVRDGLASPEHVQRFLFERRLLARLEHVNIARLLDAGVTEHGTPYFAMEYVEGEPIDVYCDTRRLSINERLRLFQTVCRVVQYAHQNLVVHRDLKPSNILVTEEGDVRLLDFGIAKLLEADASDPAEEAFLTRTGMRLMTPAYASPEQLRGDPVTTASDIYSLGVLLYELLAGQRPYEETDSHALERAHTHAPRKPSTAITDTARRTGDTTTVTQARATTLDKLHRRLSGDLDTICLKALRTEPERRYQSAEQFLEDIRRHLDGLPVTARNDTMGYRLQKFVQRNRLGVAAAAAVVLALLGGIIATTWQAQIARTERDRAEQVASILPEVFWGLEPGELQNTAVTPEQMLDRGIEQVETRLADQPEIQARILTMATDLYMRLAAYPKAEAAARQALSIRRDLYGEEHENVAASMAMLAQSLDKQGRYDESEPLHRDALAMHRKFLGSEHLDVATSLHSYAMWHNEQGQYETSEVLYREALAIRRKLRADPRDIAFTQTNLAVDLFYQDKYDEAVRHTREALALRREHLGNDHPDVAHSLHTLASILQGKGDLDEIESLFREALAIHRKSHGSTHPAVGYTLNALALVLEENAKYDEAFTILEEALTIFKQVHGEEGPWISTVIHNLALVEAGRSDYAAAESLYRQAVALKRRISGDEHPGLASSLRGLGTTLINKGTPAAAEPVLREALAIYQKAVPEGHHQIALTQSKLGACLAALNQHDEAELFLRDGFESLWEKLGLEHTISQSALRRLVDFLEAQGRPEEAARYDTLFVNQEGS